MNDPNDNIDRLLRDVHSVMPVPELPADFDRRVTRRVIQETRPRRLSAKARMVMLAYILLGAAASLWALSPELSRIGLLFVATLVLVPLSFAWTIRRLEI